MTGWDSASNTTRKANTTEDIITELGDGSLTHNTFYSYDGSSQWVTTTDSSQKRLWWLPRQFQGHRHTHFYKSSLENIKLREEIDLLHSASLNLKADLKEIEKLELELPRYNSEHNDRFVYTELVSVTYSLNHLKKLDLKVKNGNISIGFLIELLLSL